MTPSRKLLAMMISSRTSGRGNPFFYQFLLHKKPLHPSYLPASRVIGMLGIANEINVIDKENFRSSAISDKYQKFTAIPERVSDAKLSQFEERLNQISNIFKNHPASNHPLFSYLKSQSNQGFNKMQYAIYYANFLYRTKETIPSVALALARAALEGDNSTVAMHGRNLGDETGHGNPDLVHSKLLMDSHNSLGERVFDLDPLTIQDLKTSILITPEVREYCQMKAEIFRKSYPHIAGNMWAHEFAADDMLTNFKEAYFEPYKSHFTEAEYKKLMKFFDAHRDDSHEGGDVEAEHERMARQAVYFACKGDIKKLDAVLEGGLMMLDCQARVWDSILRETQKYESLMEKVAPIPALIQAGGLESTSVSRDRSPSSTVTSATSNASTIFQRSSSAKGFTP